MKKYFLVILLFMLGAITVSAQGNKIEYRNLAVEKDGFSVDVPKDFSLVYFDEKEDKFRFYGYYSPEFYLFIHSHEKNDDSPNKALFNLAKENKAKFSDLALNNFEAMKYEFLDEEGFYQNIIIVPDEKRNLVFHSVSTTKDNPSVKKFFSSIKFENVRIPAVLAEQFFNQTSETAKKILVPIAESQSKSNNGTGNGSGTGIGSGSGQGSGGGSGVGTTQNIQNKTTGVTSGLKILSKPRPSYTDIARSYNLQGTVTLRVTFLANGEIGSVTPVTKLPFGLTLSAIKAVKLMQFEPPKRNGVLYTITKAVQFSFTLY